MTIPVRLHLLESDDSNGVKLWVIALDGSNRAWYKWSENAGIAMIDAENMRLVEKPVTITPSEDRYALNVGRRLLQETEMDKEVLETWWTQASSPPAMLAIEFPIMAIADVFESNKLPRGITRRAPGGAIMELRAVSKSEQQPQLAYDAAPIFTVMVSFGRDVGISLFAAWLYDKLKPTKIRRIKINRRSIEVNPEGILRAIEESIEVEEQ